jgi:hypothetical protein
MSTLLDSVDHLVYATTDLERSVADLEVCLGVRAAMGGQHVGRRTRNALVALSHNSYLEIVGPDPAQPGIRAQRWFGIDTITTPGLIAWAAKATALIQFAAEAARNGVRLGPVIPGSRKGLNDVSLSWQFTDPATIVADGLMPFFIDWGSSPHPAISAPRGPALVSLRGQHPEPAVVERLLAVVGIELPIEQGPYPRLLATLKVAGRQIELSSAETAPFPQSV